MANTAYKYRIYPNKKQAELLACTFGCVRFVYNQCLTEQERAHGSGEPYKNRLAMNNWCNKTLKPQYPFLKDVDKFALTNAVFNLAEGYDAFFARKRKHPNYKSKRKSRMSYTTNFTNGNIAVEDGVIKLPKLGRVKAVIHRRPKEDWKLKAATVSMERDGSYYCSVLYEFNRNTQVVLNPEQNAIGLDYKSDGLFKDSEGRIGGSPKYYRKAAKRLAKAQSVLSRRQGAKQGETESNNHAKQRRKVARIHRHIANQRLDFLHKKSTEIANQYDMVCVEDLNMTDLAHAHEYKNYRKATYDNGYGMFLKLLEYKLADRGKAFVKVAKDYPSTKTCSSCGGLTGPEDDAVRSWTCPICGQKHDRDLNAAINIKKEGIRQHLAV